jgi:hypothetical protein
MSAFQRHVLPTTCFRDRAADPLLPIEELPCIDVKRPSRLLPACAETRVAYPPPLRHTRRTFWAVASRKISFDDQSGREEARSVTVVVRRAQMRPSDILINMPTASDIVTRMCFTGLDPLTGR